MGRSRCCSSSWWTEAERVTERAKRAATMKGRNGLLSELPPEYKLALRRGRCCRWSICRSRMWPGFWRRLRGWSGWMRRSGRACWRGGRSRCCFTSRARGRGPVVRAGGQVAGRDHDAGQRQILFHRKGREPEGHRADAARAGRGGDCAAPSVRRARRTLLARVTGLPVLNAGDGMHQHPSQALLDLRTILLRLGLDASNGGCADAGRRHGGDYGRHSA